ncbi:51bfaaad-8088-40d2-8e03-bdc31e5d657e [Sclerotinia trifoliorum]|uniref:51bfaaad-8088-40d2-8e03-bdc31e5d657e n=1 Tax=Sclerotinia trifoliorum TaxID=28548 RepID=A0A8H2W1N0_9HELO|nr:51bfaaad-8088-40d2-8e03-bdc31e5d657e [Sclerotinia trifoliorum]
MSGLFDITGNFSLYTIPVAWLFANVCHIYAVSATKSFDNCSPRDFPKSLESDQSIDKAKKNRIRRAHAAGANGFENIGLFASAVVAGNVAGLSNSTLNTLSGGYLISRAVYHFIYINNYSQGIAASRSLIFLVGIGHIFALFIKSGNALRDRGTNL